jgi:hypothetical protein
MGNGRHPAGRSPPATPSSALQAGLRACEGGVFPGMLRLPMRQSAQWHIADPYLAYRCGGSVGIAAKHADAPTSRFTPTGKKPAGEPEVTLGTLSPAVDTVKEGRGRSYEIRARLFFLYQGLRSAGRPLEVGDSLLSRKYLCGIVCR